MGRDADTTAAVAGALSGATTGTSAIPPAWSEAIGPSRGTCLPSMKGHHVLEVAEALVRAAKAPSEPNRPTTAPPATAPPAPAPPAGAPPAPAPPAGAPTPAAGTPAQAASGTS